MGKITILPETTKDPISLMGRRAGYCWGADVTNQEKNFKRGLDCIESGHGRVTEFPDVHFLIEGYSAKCLREYYTHIGGSPSRVQSSTRYIDYSKGDGFEYVTPHTIENNESALHDWVTLMGDINELINRFINEYGIPIEDAAMALPLTYCSKMVEKRNPRNLIEMAHQRTCTRAYWEFRELMADMMKALSEYSDEWKYIVDNFMKPKCEVVGYCTERYSCGRMPKKDA